MLKLNAGLSRKVGEPDYGSRGASVNLELEVEGHLIQDPDALHDRIRRLFVLARQAVDEELQVGRSTSRNSSNGNDATRATSKSPTRPATAAQLKAIRSIGDSRGLKPTTNRRAACIQLFRQSLCTHQLKFHLDIAAIVADSSLPNPCIWHDLPPGY